MTRKRGPKRAAKAASQKLHICVILDESGSMQAVKDATISGFNEFLADQKKAGVDGTMTLTKFNTDFNRVLDGQAISAVQPLTGDTYKPGGMTALHDAVAYSIRAMKVPDGERVVCCVITDGEENSSREHSLSEVKALIEEKEKTGLWTVTYLGANQDAWEVGRKMGIAQGNVANYVSTPVGTRAAFAAMSRGAVTMSCSAGGQTSAYYGQQWVSPTPVSKSVASTTANTTPTDAPTWRKKRKI